MVTKGYIMWEMKRLLPILVASVMLVLSIGCTSSQSAGTLLAMAPPKLAANTVGEDDDQGSSDIYRVGGGSGSSWR